MSSAYQGTSFLKGLVGRVWAGDQTEVTARFSKYNELYVAIGRGTYGELCSRGKVFHAAVSAVTIPVVAGNLISVFGIYNPPGSGVDVELIECEVTQAVATTVVDEFGIYADTAAALSALATFTTQLTTVTNRRVMDPAANLARVYSAVTHSGTPRRVAGLGQDGAVTNAGTSSRSKPFQGGLIIPPGILCSVAASVAAGAGSGLNVDMAWAEIPIQ